MKRQVDCTLILACFNEEGLFKDSVHRIKQVLAHSKFTFELLFVDDASSDQTTALIRSELAHKNMEIRAIFHKKNTGRGRAVTDGIRAARGTVVGYIDIDCEVSPVYIPQMVTPILKHQADIVIGKRFYRSSIGSILREILSRGYQWLSNSLIGTAGLDTESGYKFFHRKKILPILKKTNNPGWFWDTEIMVYALRAGLLIQQEPVLFLRRFDKRSSVNIVRDTLDYMKELVTFRNKLA